MEEIKEQLSKEMDNIKGQLTKYEHTVERLISDKIVDSYKNGFKEGMDLSNHINKVNMDIKNIDLESIKVFAKWCYINGIDFSYMTKATDKIPFIDRVLNRFKTEMDLEGK